MKYHVPSRLIEKKFASQLQSSKTVAGIYCKLYLRKIAFCLSSMPPTWALPEIKQPMRDLRGEVDWNARGNLVKKRNDPRKLKFISLTIVRYTCDACIRNRTCSLWGLCGSEHRSAESEGLRLSGRASERRIRKSEVRFLMGTQIFFFFLCTCKTKNNFR